MSAAIDAKHLERQREWSGRTFGRGPRLLGILDHIRKELVEIECAPLDLSEWADVVILALDGAWRSGHEPQQIIDAIIAKQARNEAREWPDWRDASEDKAIEHVQAPEALFADVQRSVNEDPDLHVGTGHHMSAPPCDTECGQMIRDYFYACGMEVTVTTVPPLIANNYEDLGMRCPHGVLWHSEPTSDQVLAWVEGTKP